MILSAAPTGWEHVPLSELLLGIDAGKSFKCEERPPNHDEIGVMKVSAVTWGEYNEVESKTCTDASRINPDLFVEAGDFLFSRANTIELVGACVIAARVTQRVMLSDKILRLKFADDRLKPWVLHFLRSHKGREQIERLASGNQESMRNIGQERIGQIQIPIPPERERQCIVEKLEALLVDLEAGAHELKAAQRKLVRYRQSLLRAAVEGAVTADWRAAHGTLQDTGAGLLQRILTERRARWEQKQLAKFAEQDKPAPKGWQAKYPEPTCGAVNNLPALPAGWAWATVDQLSPDDLANGRSVPTANAGAKVLRLTAVREGRIDLSQWKHGAWSEEDARPYAVAQGDLLIVRGNGSLALVGRAGLVGEVAEQIAYPDTLIRLRTLDAVVRSQWVAAVWESSRSRAHLEGRARTSAGIYKISQPDIVSMVIPVPPLPEQDAILAELGQQRERINALASVLDAELRRAEAQRMNILKAAFAGHLVRQDPDDESASELLVRIRAECLGGGSASRRYRKTA